MRSLSTGLITSNDYIIQSDNAPEQEIQSKIDKTSLFVGYLTSDYFKCNKSYFELQHAINMKKECLFLLTSSYQTIAESIKNSPGAQEAQDNLNLTFNGS